MNTCLRFCKMFNYKKYLFETLNITYFCFVNRVYYHVVFCFRHVENLNNLSQKGNMLFQKSKTFLTWMVNKQNRKPFLQIRETGNLFKKENDQSRQTRLEFIYMIHISLLERTFTNLISKIKELLNDTRSRFHVNITGMLFRDKLSVENVPVKSGIN